PVGTEAGEQPSCWYDYVSFGVVGSPRPPDAILRMRHASAPPNIHLRLPPKPRDATRSDGQVFAVIDDALQPVENSSTYWIGVPFTQFGTRRAELLDVTGKVRDVLKSLGPTP